MRILQSSNYSHAPKAWSGRRPKLWFLALQLTVTLTFLARGWLYWRWDSPVRGIFWQEDWWTPVLDKWFNTTWDDFAYESDAYITKGIEWTGILLMLLALAPLFLKRDQSSWKQQWWLKLPILLGCGILLIDNIGRYCESDFNVGMFIEHTLQVFAPLFLLLYPLAIRLPSTWAHICAFFASLTFIGHGLFAFGYYPVPAKFINMTIDILRFSETFALKFLYVMGILDFIVAVTIFIPALRRLTLYYMITWGFVTAAARVVANVNSAEKYYALDPWVAETIVRTSHWLIPLILLAMLPKVLGKKT